ncbi:MAG: hypothetical protein NVS3B16_23310 [Vulcanimicrobiaceae bacterium]
MPYLDKKVEVRLRFESENGPIVYRGYLEQLAALPGWFAVVTYHNPEPDDRTHESFQPHEVATISPMREDCHALAGSLDSASEIGTACFAFALPPSRHSPHYRSRRGRRNITCQRRATARALSSQQHRSIVLRRRELSGGAAVFLARCMR